MTALEVHGIPPCWFELRSGDVVALRFRWSDERASYVLEDGRPLSPNWDAAIEKARGLVAPAKGRKR